MLLSKSCFYGLRAGMYVATLGQAEYVPILRISNELNISFHFLTKILQTLTENNIMISYRGPKGGVALARPARSIRLIDIVYAIDGAEIFNQCVFGLPGCGVQAPCPLHGEWAASREKIRHMFEKTTLAELAEKINEFNLRISEKPAAVPRKRKLTEQTAAESL